MKNIKNSYLAVFILLVLAVICFSTSYAIFMNVNEQSGKLNIVVGDLNYKLESADLVNNKVTVAPNTVKELVIKLTSLNEIDSKYEVYYNLNQTNENLVIGYNIDTKDPVIGTINANEVKEISIIISNGGTTEETVELNVKGGLVNNELVLNDGNSLNQELGKLSKAIFNEYTTIYENPTLTDSSNNTSDPSGLYKSVLTNSGDPTYYFRGNVENYLDFAGFTWRVVRINEDGTIRIVMQNGIDNNKNYEFNKTNSTTYQYMYYSESEAKSTLETWYNANITSNEIYASKVVAEAYFCEEAKVKLSSSYTSGNAIMEVYSIYKPTFKCITDDNGKGIVNASIGLITYDEAVYAGVYYAKSNSSNYLNNNNYFWTMSAAGVPSTSNAHAWNISSTGNLGDYQVYNAVDLRPVLNLKADTVVTGLGTSDSHWVVAN